MFKVVPVAGVHALELYITPTTTVARLLTNGRPNKNYPVQLIDPKTEVFRLQQALRGGPDVFLDTIRKAT